MNIEERMNLIKQVGEEILTEEELRTLLETKKHPVAYDGFEPSGRIHIAQGVLRTINVNKMLKAGCEFKMWVADWFGWMNNKMGGDLEKIRTVGEYFIQVWKACGMDTEHVEFLWAKDVMKEEEYWKIAVQVARHTTLQRVLRCSQIMGRKETDNLMASQIFYPCMQAADIFYLNHKKPVDICQLGMDQRKVNILAREVGPTLGFPKPVAVHHHMLMGLTPPQPAGSEEKADRTVTLKMSKSNPNSAVFMDDTAEDIKHKLNKAYCPEKQTQENPILEYCKYILFEHKPELTIKRPTKFGGNLELQSYAKLQEAFAQGNIHPMDLKNTVAEELNLLLEPIRAKLAKGKAKELGDKVRSFTVTR